MKLSNMARALPFVFLGAARAIAAEISGETIVTSAAKKEEGFDVNRYLVRYHNVQGLGKAVEMSNGNVHAELNRQKAVAVNLSAEAVDRLKKDPDIDVVEKDPVRFLDATSSVRGGGVGGGRRSLEKNASRRLAEQTPYGISMVQADQLSYDSSSAASAKKVCIIDSGYDDGHPDLPTGASGTVTFDPVSGPRRADEDVDGHGTHVTGTVAAIGNNGIGVRGVIDDPAVPLHIVRVFVDSGQGPFIYASGLVGALNDCVASGADVINLSIGCTGSFEFCYSNIEEDAFTSADFYDGVLTFSSAGNDASTAFSFPASYTSVVSVGAVDPTETVTSFSQKNVQVELVAPGEAVLSTVVRGTGVDASFTVGGTDYLAIELFGSVQGTVVAPLFLCNAVDGLGSQGDCEGAAGSICLISRGAISFGLKVLECERAGGVGAVVYNNVPGIVYRALGEDTTIPAVLISQEDGIAAQAQLGQNAIVSVQDGGDYGYKSGTSMSSPHAAGVAALVWSNHPDCSNYEIRSALHESAKDLGDVGDDDSYGHGLVQAKAASDYLTLQGCVGATGPVGGSGGTCRNGSCDACGPRGFVCTVHSECCTGRCKGTNGNKTCK